ncbi:MAG: glycosyltransferase, partial [Candidatus Edwardsbacteria bacterium]|nr:glycosyltransferase [Candidatus Edwardsbacteria bacterium]
VKTAIENFRVTLIGKKKKILFFDHVPILGGAEQSLLDILRVLDRSRFEPFLLLTNPGPVAERARELGVPVAYISAPRSILRRKRYNIKFFSPRSLWDAVRLVPVIWRVAALIAREKIDIVHTNTLKTHLIGGIAGRLCGRRVVWHFRDILIEKNLRSWMVWLSHSLSDHVIAVSQAVKKQFGAGYPADRITVIYNAIDSGEIEALAARKDAAGIRRELSLPPHCRLVGMVGQIARWKGQECFIRAAAKLAPRFPDLRFVVIGDVLFDEWEYKTRLLELVKELGLEQRVVFAGQIADVPPHFKALDVLVHCSVEPEPFGRVVIEAMALGVPVVAARGGAINEIITDGADGLLVPSADARALAEAVAALLDEPSRAEAMAGRARDRSRCFELTGTVSQVERILSNL